MVPVLDDHLDASELKSGVAAAPWAVVVPLLAAHALAKTDSASSDAISMAFRRLGEFMPAGSGNARLPEPRTGRRSRRDFIGSQVREILTSVVAGLAGQPLGGLSLSVGLVAVVVGFGAWWTYFDFTGQRQPRPTRPATAQWMLGHLRRAEVDGVPRTAPSPLSSSLKIRQIQLS